MKDVEKQGDLSILNEPTAMELLASAVPARLAYNWSDGTPRVIPGADGDKLVPSVIYFDETDGVLVGNGARQKMVVKSRNTIFSIKRFMGKGIEDVRADLPLLPFEVSPDSEHIIRLKIFGRDYTPPELSALILRELKRNAEAALGEAESLIGTYQDSPARSAMLASLTQAHRKP